MKVRSEEKLILFSRHIIHENTPESEHGELFFITWDQDQWEDFYLLMARCIQRYLESGIILPRFNVAERALRMEAPSAFIDFMNIFIEPNVKYDKKLVYADFYGLNPSVGRVELTTFRKWLKLYADAYGYKLNESHSGNDNFFQYNKE